MQRYRSEKSKTGANLTGTTGTSGRTYTLSHGNIVAGSTSIHRNGAYLHENTHYTRSGQTITFIVIVDDEDIIDFEYFTDVPGGAGNTYASTLDVVRVTGIASEIFDEIVGTGNGSATSFDLDNGNVIDGSYTLRYGASGSNSLVDLTENTHYNIDLDSGRILLTASGVTALSTNVLYASYVHSVKMSNSQLESYLAAADAEVDGITGDYWGAGVARTEFFDGYERFAYPTTDEPYARDYDTPESFQLSRRNVLSVTGVYFLARGTAVSSAFSYDTSSSTYVNITSAVNSVGETGSAPFATVTASGDMLYIGGSSKFFGLMLGLFTPGATSGTNTIQYWNGSAWTAFSATESAPGVLNLTANGKLTWSPLASWARTTVNGSASLFYVRILAGSTYTTEPVLSYAAFDQDSVISQQIPPFAVSTSSYGTVTLNGYRSVNGVRNVRIDYINGKASVPPLIVELASLIAGLQVFAAITGGSYDDATHYQLGRKEVTIGETYTNVAEVVKQMRARIDAITKEAGVGYRYSFGAV